MTDEMKLEMMKPWFQRNLAYLPKARKPLVGLYFGDGTVTPKTTGYDYACITPSPWLENAVRALEDQSAESKEEG